MGKDNKVMRGGYCNVTASSSEECEKQIKVAQSLEELLGDCPHNKTIADNLVKAWETVNNPKYKKIMCSISGGADSDVMLDIIYRCDKDCKADYVWFDTGIEYFATKDHLRFLKNKYRIKIKTYKAIKSIPLTCKQYGQPFLNKRVSQFISGLQRVGFKWEDKSLDDLMKEYPNSTSYLKWWTNHQTNGKKRFGMYEIAGNKWLKEFMIVNPPTFKISDKCCKYAKKDVSNQCVKDNGYDLSIVGVRKAEGGNRAKSYKSCFDEDRNGCDNYRPLFWYKNSDKEDYERHYGVTHSRCYTEYGLTRTGCAGCPFGIRELQKKLDNMEKYEPQLFIAANNIFKDSYEYTRKYQEFCKMKNEEEKRRLHN